MGDLVRSLDEAAQQRGALDDRGIRLGVRDRRHVLHEADEELRAADLIELAARCELGLHGLETQGLATVGDPLDRAEDEAMLLARKRGRRDAPAHDPLVDRGIDEDRAEQRGLGLGILGRRLRRAAFESVVDRHTGIESSAALLKNFACSLANSSEKMPVGPLRFFAMLPWISFGAPAAVSSLSRQSMSTTSESCSIAPLSRSVESFGSRPESPAARESCERPMTTTLSSRASDLRFFVMVAISCTRFSSCSPVRMSWM